ncbi:MAG: FxsA family protein [Methylophilaceae bacterium]|jgi:UPF0716 protein FxsA
MRLIFLLGILAFPVVEIWILINLFQQYGSIVVLYLLVVAVLGIKLIRDEKSLFSVRMMQTLSQGANPFKAIFGSARNIIAGILLVIPGIMSDIIAAVLLLIPISSDAKKTEGYQTKPAANDDVIEGEFHREE